MLPTLTCLNCFAVSRWTSGVSLAFTCWPRRRWISVSRRTGQSRRWPTSSASSSRQRRTSWRSWRTSTTSTRWFCPRTLRYGEHKHGQSVRVTMDEGFMVSCVPAGRRPEGTEAPGGRPGDVWEAARQSEETVGQTNEARPARRPAAWILS